MDLFKKRKTIDGQLLLFMTLAILLSCNSDYRFDRDIVFGQGWTVVATKSVDNNSTIYGKHFDLEIDSEKIYLLTFDDGLHLSSLNVNNHKVVQGTFADGTLYFNLTPFLNESGLANNLELCIKDASEQEQCKSLLRGSSLLCVNKLFMSSIKYGSVFHMANRSIDIVIRNSYDTERQGILKYSYFKDEKIVKIYTTPVFISANSENLYQHTIADEIPDLTTVECELYSQGALMDKHEVVIK
ncbi:hypothetical protein KDU71_00575 [Carboxylicivirga sediminis]|uniref:Uncharacterized protein n=1 Tax=Carboxylicivirga sediminis TaxID=2006564 RepID=A0A941EZF2_9BACT|nr:hypothetical protein [Carboxylicivirga sediminis]MBR8534039.1 hypothetical protein [Carboxylicivirga sediminis]